MVASLLAAGSLLGSLAFSGLLLPAHKDLVVASARREAAPAGGDAERRAAVATRPAVASAAAVAAASLTLPPMPTRCQLAWRPGLAARLPRGAELGAWANATVGTPPLGRLERFFAKLQRGEVVTVYFLGDSVTRGSGANHECHGDGCDAPPDPPEALHPWLRAPSRAPAGGGAACGGANGSAPRGGDPYAHCTRAANKRSPQCLSPTSHAAPPASSAAGRSLAAFRCYPRNSWKCLTVSWLEAQWPGQVAVVLSSKPLLFMAACFGRTLATVDLLLHEQAVNGGAKMLCLQERVLHAALTRSADLAALLLLWLPKTFTPDVRGQIQWAQEGLGALGGHYALPTLSIARALARRCADGERWCYDRAHGTQGGGRQSLHADLNHPNDGGHALFAAHVHALFAAAADAAAARLRAGAPPPRVAPLPPPLYPSNGALGSPGAASSAASSALALPGGATSPPAAGWEGGGLCVDVAEMAASARANEGWSVVTEVAASKIARLPALQAESAGARAEWQLDVRGADFLIVTYMQSYAGFGALELRCVQGCDCALHDSGTSAGAGMRGGDGGGGGGGGGAARRPHGASVINATDPAARFSEPQWSLLDLSQHSAACVLRATSLSSAKFKLMLISLVRARPAGVPDGGGAAAGDAQAVAAERARREAALKCFGVTKDATINSRVRSTAPWEALTGGGPSSER